MAINKKLIHFNKKESFNTELANNNILNTSIVFIKDSKEIWTHGQLYATQLTVAEIESIIANSPSVEDVLAQIAAEVTARDKAVMAEKHRAEQAEATLSANIESEIARSTAKDEAHIAAINKEIQDRTNAIATEVTNRDAAIEVETNRALAAERTLQTNINSTNTAINDEVDRATEAEQLIQTNLTNEITRAKAAEQGLDSKITDHTNITDTALALKADKSDTYTKSQVDQKVSGLYKVKGSSTFEDLPKTNTVGDTYNITNSFTLNEVVYPAGTNIVYTGNGWDALSGVFDTTALEGSIQTVADNLTKESVRAKEAESALSTSIANEVTNRTQADTAMQSNITTLTNKVNANEIKLSTVQGDYKTEGSINKALEDAKAYTNSVVSGLDSTVTDTDGNVSVSITETDGKLFNVDVNVDEESMASAMAGLIGTATLTKDGLQSKTGYKNLVQGNFYPSCKVCTITSMTATYMIELAYVTGDKNQSDIYFLDVAKINSEVKVTLTRLTSVTIDFKIYTNGSHLFIERTGVGINVKPINKTAVDQMEAELWGIPTNAILITPTHSGPFGYNTLAELSAGVAKSLAKGYADDLNNETANHTVGMFNETTKNKPPFAGYGMFHVVKPEYVVSSDTFVYQIAIAYNNSSFAIRSYWSSLAKWSNWTRIDNTEEDWYGVSWSENWSSPTCIRIGNMSMHRSLPILSAMKQYAIRNSFSNSIEQNIISPYDSVTKTYAYSSRDNSQPSHNSTSVTNIMVKIPEFWYIDDYVAETKTHNLKISQHPKAGWNHHKEAYVGAYEGDITTSYLFSRIGHVPTVNADRDAFRTAARKNNAAGEYKWNIYTYEEHRAICHLFLVEYATRNCQAPVNASLTADGFKQGGLGAGVTTGTMNGAYSFVPTGTSDSLGNGSGQVAYTAANGTTYYVPRYRGIENPFGHIWKHCDDVITQIVESGYRTAYKCEDPSQFATNKNAKYKPLCSFASGLQGWKKEIKVTANCDFFPVSIGGSESTYWCDYAYDNTDTSEHCLLIGSHSGNGGGAGLFYLLSYAEVGYSDAHIGSRLTYLPWAE